MSWVYWPSVCNHDNENSGKAYKISEKNYCHPRFPVYHITKCIAVRLRISQSMSNVFNSMKTSEENALGLIEQRWSAQVCYRIPLAFGQETINI